MRLRLFDVPGVSLQILAGVSPSHEFSVLFTAFASPLAPKAFAASPIQAAASVVPGAEWECWAGAGSCLSLLWLGIAAGAGAGASLELPLCPGCSNPIPGGLTAWNS